MSSPLMGLDAAFLIAFIVESVLYGIFLMLFAACMWVLLFRRNQEPVATRRPVLKIYVAASLLFMTLTTTHFILNFVRVLQAFILFRDAPGPVSGTILYYANSANPTYLAKTAVWSIQTWAADLLMIWRVYHIYGGKLRVIILPSILWLVLVVASSFVIWEFKILQPGTVIFVSALGRWILTSFTAVLTTNVTCTGLIAYKLLSSHRRVGRVSFGAGSLVRVVTILVESAAIYVIAQFITLILYLVKSNGQFIVIDALGPITGIVFSLVIVRVGLTGENGGSSSSHIVSSRFTRPAPRETATGIEVSVLREIDSEMLGDDAFEKMRPNAF